MIKTTSSPCEGIHRPYQYINRNGSFKLKKKKKLHFCMEEKCVKQSSCKSYLNYKIWLLFSITKYISAVNRNTLEVGKSVQFLHKTWSSSYCVRSRNSTSMMGFYLIKKIKFWFDWGGVGLFFLWFFPPVFPWDVIDAIPGKRSSARNGTILRQLNYKPGKKKCQLDKHRKCNRQLVSHCISVTNESSIKKVCCF